MSYLHSIKIKRPHWDDIDRALNNAFEYGGCTVLEHLGSKSSYIQQLDMQSLRNQFRIVVLTNEEEEGVSDLLEWWEPEVTKYRGTINFDDDSWDARTVCSDLTVARRYFIELYETGELSKETLRSLRRLSDPPPY